MLRHLALKAQIYGYGGQVASPGVIRLVEARVTLQLRHGFAARYPPTLGRCQERTFNYLRYVESFSHRRDVFSINPGAFITTLLRGCVLY